MYVLRYLQYPMLIGGKKFDMRLYALVSSFSPLKGKYSLLISFEDCFWMYMIFVYYLNLMTFCSMNMIIMMIIMMMHAHSLSIQKGLCKIYQFALLVVNRGHI